MSHEVHSVSISGWYGVAVLDALDWPGALAVRYPAYAVDLHALSESTQPHELVRRAVLCLQ